MKYSLLFLVTLPLMLSSICFPAEKANDSCVNDDALKQQFDIFSEFAKQAEDISHLADAAKTIPAIEELKGAWKNSEWTAHLRKEIINSEILNFPINDLKDYCPTSKSYDQKLDCLTLFFIAVAKNESEYNPKQGYLEDFGVTSAGLYQISIESAKGYGCQVKQTEDLFDPYANISCALKIFSKLVKRDGVISGKKLVNGKTKQMGAGAYWSTMRAPYKYKTKSNKTLNLGKKIEIAQQVNSWSNKILPVIPK